MKPFSNCRRKYTKQISNMVFVYGQHNPHLTHATRIILLANNFGLGGILNRGKKSNTENLLKSSKPSFTPRQTPFGWVDKNKFVCVRLQTCQYSKG